MINISSVSGNTQNNSTAFNGQMVYLNKNASKIGRKITTAMDDEFIKKEIAQIVPKGTEKKLSKAEANLVVSLFNKIGENKIYQNIEDMILKNKNISDKGLQRISLENSNMSTPGASFLDILI